MYSRITITVNEVSSFRILWHSFLCFFVKTDLSIFQQSALVKGERHDIMVGEKLPCLDNLPQILCISSRINWNKFIPRGAGWVFFLKTLKTNQYVVDKP
jgi:hypothetical protein